MYRRIERLLRIHPLMPHAAMWISLFLVTLADYFKGAGYSSFTFYLLPIGIAVWYTTKPLMALMVVLSSVLWLYCQMHSGFVYPGAFALYWNATLRLLTFSVFAYLMYALRTTLEAMTAMAMRDGLTQLSNGRAFLGKYQMVQAMAARRRSALAMAVIDLDGFKAVNGTHGHLEGDKVLRSFAQVLKDVSRTSDMICRPGGDEFMVILTDASETAVQAYDARLRKAFAEAGLKDNYGVDFSMGVVVFATPPQELAKASAVADALMYEAKQNGRSQTVFRFFADEKAQ